MNSRAPIIVKRNNPHLISYRLKSRLSIIKDKYLNWVHLSRVLFPVIVLVVLMPAVLVLTVYRSYERRILATDDLFPEELRQMVIFIKYEDIDNNPDVVRRFAQNAADLYTSQKVYHIYVYSISVNKSLFPVKDKVAHFFSTIPDSKIDINVTVKDELDICRDASTSYKLSKFILMSYRDVLIQLAYKCNASNIYTISYLPDNMHDIYSGSDIFLKTLETIIRTGFS